MRLKYHIDRRVSIEFQKIGLEKCKFKRMMEAQRFSEEKYFISPSRSAIH